MKINDSDIGLETTDDVAPVYDILRGWEYSRFDKCLLHFVTIALAIIKPRTRRTGEENFVWKNPWIFKKIGFFNKIFFCVNWITDEVHQKFLVLGMNKTFQTFIFRSIRFVDLFIVTWTSSREFNVSTDLFITLSIIHYTHWHFTACLIPIHHHHHHHHHLFYFLLPTISQLPHNFWI